MTLKSQVYVLRSEKLLSRTSSWVVPVALPGSPVSARASPLRGVSKCLPLNREIGNLQPRKAVGNTHFRNLLPAKKIFAGLCQTRQSATKKIHRMGPHGERDSARLRDWNRLCV